ncbi:MAG: porin [Rhodospirillales bacterium]|jgi:phosphate-selective porin OprO/OprP|nr:porin [Rhodospirillales bacterium]
MTSKKLLLAGTILSAAFAVSTDAMAQTTTSKTTKTTTTTATSDTAVLRQQVLDLQKQLNDLKAQVGTRVTSTEKTVEELKKASASDVKVTLPNGRPTIATNDGNFSFAVTGRIHFDTAGYFSTKSKNGSPSSAVPDLNSGVNVRRAFFGVTGKLWKDWEYVLNLNAGGSGQELANSTALLQEARLTYGGVKNWKFDIGYLDPQNNLSEAMSSNDLAFIERAAVTNITEGIAATESRAAVGARFNTENIFASGYLTGSTVGNGPLGAGVTAGDEQIGVVGRVAFLPYKSDVGVIHIGINGQKVLQNTQNQTPGPKSLIGGFSDRPELRVDGRSFVNAVAVANTNSTAATFNIDTAYAYGLELAGAYRNFYAEGQYFRFGYDTQNIAVTGTGIPGRIAPSVDFDGYYAQATYVLTGESRAYNIGTGAFGSPKPARPVSLETGGIGAWEVGVRYSYVNLNDTNGGFIVNGGKQTLWTFGVNWYVNNNVRFMLNYITGDIDKKAVLTNAPQGFKMDTLALRTQFNF